MKLSLNYNYTAIEFISRILQLKREVSLPIVVAFQ